MTTPDFPKQLRQWRKANRIKQSALAQQLNATQSAISRWETGKDHPNPAMLQRILALVAFNRYDTVLEQAYIERQTGTVALFDLAGVRLLATSAGLKRVWPEFSSKIGTPFYDCLVGESRDLVSDKSIVRAAEQGRTIIANGVSLRHIDMDCDRPILHSWHARLRPNNGQVLVDMVYEQCEECATQGIVDVLGLDI